MKKNKKRNEKIVHEKQVDEEQTVDEVNDVEIEDDIEVNDPGDCIGHWAECEECEMCEIQDSCEAMTKNISGEENGEKK